MSTAATTEKATFGEGCFWGVEKIFRKHYEGKGLLSTRVGYEGGHKANPTYREVCSGTTNHAEVLLVEFDPTKLGYATLVEFFFRTHDPTQFGHQGPDVGEQYRSVIFTHSDEQLRIAQQVKDEVQKVRYPGKPLATVIEPAQKFWDAEEYHQLYLDKNPAGYECPTHFLHW